MYNTDGTVKPRAARNPAPKSTLNLSWGEEDVKENIIDQNNQNQLPAGVKSGVTSLGAAQPAAKQRPGAAERHLANQGSLRFSDNGDEDAGPVPRNVSDAKRKALYESHVFGNSQSPARAPAHVLSEYKKKEQTGSDIFHHTDKPQEQQRAVLGGVKKAPGGIYYPSGSLRAKLCVSGKKQLYSYCSEKGVPHNRIGKLIVAKDKDQVTKLRNYLENGKRNGVNDLKWLSKADVKKLEPEVKCEAAVLSPSTGIVDLKSLIQAYMDDAREDGAQLMLDSTVISGSLEDPVKRLTIERSGSGQRVTLLAQFVVNSAGLNAQDVSRCLQVPAGSIPRKYYAKGNYFAFKGKPPFKHLIYPLPHQGGLGTHLTLDLQGGAKFGPDVEYQDDMNFEVNTSRMGGFYNEIREYWPGLPDDSLKPAFAGIRPKLHGPGEAQDDFLIDSRSVPGYIALYGIESPGLTSSLAIGGYVADIVQAKARL